MKHLIAGVIASTLMAPVMAQQMNPAHPHNPAHHQKMHEKMHGKSVDASASSSPSVLPGYAPNADDKLQSWSAANQRVQEAGGWKAYAQEIAKDQATQTPALGETTLPVLTLERAIQQALDANPSLRQTIANIDSREETYPLLSPHQREAITQKERLIAGVKERYFAAVAAQERANYKRTINEAAAVAAEVALRMRKVGNLNFEHQGKDQLSFARTAIAWNNAALKATLAKEQLGLYLGHTGNEAAFSLPNKLPDLPHHFPAPSALTQLLLTERHAVAGAASSVPSSARIRSESRQALAEAENAYRIARHYKDEILPLRKKLSDENLLRYNGMLIGVFDLLSDARHQIEAVEGYLDALHAYWVADTRLTAVLVSLKEDSAQFRRNAWTR